MINGPNRGHLRPQEEVGVALFSLSARKVCTVPRCLETRRIRGQRDGRFLFAYRWTERSVIIDTICSECGSVHSVEIVIPKKIE